MSSSKLVTGCITGFVLLLFLGVIALFVYLDLAINSRLTMMSYGVIALVLFIGVVQFFVSGVVAGNSKTLQTGQPAQATVMSVRETGLSLGETEFQIALKLQVAAPGLAPFIAEAKTFVSRINPGAYQPGMTVAIRYDPKNPQKIAVEGPIAMPAVTVRPMAAIEAGSRLSMLENLRKSGLINEQEFQLKRQEILKGM